MQDWLDLLQRLIRDPAQNPAAVGIGVGIVVVFVVILVLALVALALPSARKASPTSDTQATPRRRLSARASILVAFAGAILLTFAGAALWYHQTSSSDYCTGSCHSMARASAAWELSAHKDIACMRCHEGRKWNSLPTGVSNRLDCLYAQYSGKPAHARPVSPSTCISCHTSMSRRTVIGRDGDEFLHDSAYASGQSCTSCHEAQGHVPEIR